MAMSEKERLTQQFADSIANRIASILEAENTYDSASRNAKFDYDMAVSSASSKYTQTMLHARQAFMVTRVNIEEQFGLVIGDLSYDQILSATKEVVNPDA